METSVFEEIASERGNFESDENVRETVRIVLDALGESISGGEAEAVADQLPAELGDRLRSTGEEHEPMAYEAFLDRVSEEAGIDRDRAQVRAQAVIDALREGIDEFDFENLHGQLPEEYDPLFTAATAEERPLVDATTADTDLDDPAAERAARAVLDTLGERLTLGEARRVAAHLSAESAWLIDSEDVEADEFGPEEFLDRVADREGLAEDVAREHTEAVFAALAAVLPREELHDLQEQLGPDYHRLFP